MGGKEKKKEKDPDRGILEEGPSRRGEKMTIPSPGLPEMLVIARRPNLTLNLGAAMIQSPSGFTGGTGCLSIGGGDVIRRN